MQMISPQSLKDTILKIHVNFHGDKLAQPEPACFSMWAHTILLILFQPRFFFHGIVKQLLSYPPVSNHSWDVDQVHPAIYSQPPGWMKLKLLSSIIYCEPQPVCGSPVLLSVIRSRVKLKWRRLRQVLSWFFMRSRLGVPEGSVDACRSLFSAVTVPFCVFRTVKQSAQREEAAAGLNVPNQAESGEKNHSLSSESLFRLNVWCENYFSYVVIRTRCWFCKFETQKQTWFGLI